MMDTILVNGVRYIPSQVPLHLRELLAQLAVTASAGDDGRFAWVAAAALAVAIPALGKKLKAEALLSSPWSGAGLAYSSLREQGMTEAQITEAGGQLLLEWMRERWPSVKDVADKASFSEAAQGSQS